MDIKIGHKIKTISFMIDQDIRSKNSSLNPGQGFLLSFIDKHGGQVCQNTLEDVFKIRRSSLSSAIKSLENEGYIKRIESIKDKRIKEIILLDKGKEIATKIKEDIIENEQKLIKGLNEEEIETLFSLLTKVQTNLEGERK